MASIVYAAIDGTVAHAGLRIKLNPGEAWDASDPLVQERPELFTSQPAQARTTTGSGFVPVEEATARPGERRQVRAR